jgi:hypothetical protein
MLNELEINDIEKVALAGVIKDKEIKELKRYMDAGKHNVSFLVRVDAEISKSEPVEKKVPASISKTDLLMYLLSKMNRNTRQATLKAFSMNDYTIPEALEDELKADWDALSLTTTKMTGGQTRIKGTAVKVEEA